VSPLRLLIALGGDHAGGGAGAGVATTTTRRSEELFLNQRLKDLTHTVLPAMERAVAVKNTTPADASRGNSGGSPPRQCCGW